MVSIGNFKECTVAVWEFATGKLITTSYTLDKINDLRISVYVDNEDRLFEFCTVFF